MKDLKTKIIELCSLMSVSGFEERATDALFSLVGEGFSETYKDSVGNHVFVKRSEKENAPKILVDAHFDEIGMIVTEILDGGFLRFTRMGGIDVSILQAADVIIYGKEKIRGVIASTPPHLRSSDNKKLPKMEELLIDTGYSKEKLEEIVSVGTPVGFPPIYSELLDSNIAGKSFDDKACAAIALAAVSRVPREELAGDVYVVLSSYEETSRLGGISPITLSISPDYAMVIDVNLGRVKDTPTYETVEMGKGISISFSAATDKKLTRATRQLLIDKEIPHSVVAAPSSTGTNAASVNLVGTGVPVVDIGLPLKNMHTYNEVISMNDALALRRLVEEFITDASLAKLFGEEATK